MGRPPSRRFSVVDVAILLIFAGLAAAAAYRVDRAWAGVVDPSFARFDPKKGTPAWFQALVVPCMRLYFDYVTVLGIGTLGVAIVLFRGRSPRRRRPGAGRVVVAVVTILQFFHLANEVARMWPALGWPPGFTAVEWSKWLWVNMAPGLFAAALGARVAQALAGRRRGVRAIDPRERLGRAVAWCWFGSLGLAIVMTLLWP